MSHSNRTILRCTTGNSSKEYRVFVFVDQYGSANLETAYGRIGAHRLNSRVNLMNVSHHQARHAANQIIREKLRKGYTIYDTSESNVADPPETPFDGTDDQAVTASITTAVAPPQRKFQVAL